MKETIEIKVILKSSPPKIYKAWLNGSQHTQMTGGEATAGDKVGDEFTAWDGYIWGKNLDLKPNKEIIQSWRTSQFSEDDEDSKLQILLNSVGEGTELTLIHTNIPEGESHYEQGWKEHYFEPMKEYFDV